jgi:hypothetical protein
MMSIDRGKLRNIGRDLTTVGPPPHLVDDFRYNNVKL